MDRQKFLADLEALNDLVALAQTNVESYKRRTKSGKTVDVKAHMRSVEGMSNPDLFGEYKTLAAGGGDLPDSQKKNRLAQVVNEIRKRKSKGEWGTTNKTQGQVTAEKIATPAGAEPPKTPGKVPDPAKPEAPKTDAAKPEGSAEDQTPAEKAQDKPGWKPGAEPAMTHFLNEKHAKQQAEEGIYTPTRQEESEWGARMDRMLAQPLDDGTLSDFEAGPSTATAHLVKDENGQTTFTPERQALHKKIIAAFLDGYSPREKPRYHMMGGGPASGKSVMERANPEISSGHAVINADEVKGMLPEAWGPDGKMDAGLAHEESSHVAKLINKEAFNRSLGVTLDGTGDGGAAGVRKKLKQARDAGYEVHGYYVSTDVETAIARAKQRAAKPPYRMVPEGLLRKTHIDVTRTFKEVVNEFDSVKLYDSTTREGVLTGEKPAGGRLSVKDTTGWQAFLSKENDPVPQKKAA